MRAASSPAEPVVSAEGPGLDQLPSCELPTPWGIFTVYGIREGKGLPEHAVLTFGAIAAEAIPVVRVHSECLTGDGLVSLRCDCGAQLAASFKYIAHYGRSMIVYLRQEGGGIGLVNKVRAYGLQDTGLDTVDANLALGFPADLRDYKYCAEILCGCGIRHLRLLTNNPAKAAALRRLGLDVLEEIPLVAGQNPFNRRYLGTKAQRMGHRLQPGAHSIKQES